jgi:CheY-like chemotaxis protein
MQNKIKLFLVDDDPLFLKVLALQFAENDNYIIETFSTGELCIQNLSKIPDVIILDYYLNGINKNAMNGIDTLKYIKNYTSFWCLMFFLFKLNLILLVHHTQHLMLFSKTIH